MRVSNREGGQGMSRHSARWELPAVEAKWRHADFGHCGKPGRLPVLTETHLPDDMSKPT